MNEEKKFHKQKLKKNHIKLFPYNADFLPESNEPNLNYFKRNKTNIYENETQARCCSLTSIFEHIYKPLESL